MSHRLLVVVPQIGLLSETFIRRHACELLPASTAVVVDPPPGADRKVWWQHDGPLLELSTGSTRTTDYLPLSSNDTGRVLDFARTVGARAIIGEFLDFSHRFLAVARAAHLPFFAFGHGIDLSAQMRNEVWRSRYLDYVDAARVVVPTRCAAERLAGIGLPASALMVVPYGVDVPSALPARPPQSPVRCVAVGRLIPKKAPDLVLRAVQAAREQFPAMRLDLVGDGPLREKVEALAAGPALVGTVWVRGPLPPSEVQEVMCTADIFLHHARTDPDSGNAEGLPNVILEAMSHGIPVVATRHEGIPEAVSDGETGYLVDEGDWRAMADRLVALARDPDLRRRMGVRGWQRATRDFAWTDTRQRLLHILGLSEPVVGLMSQPCSTTPPTLRRETNVELP